MHADLPPMHDARRESGWGRDVLLAVLVHLALVAIFLLAWLWSPSRSMEAAAGEPLEASLAVSAAETAAVRSALSASEGLESLPEVPDDAVEAVMPEPVPEDTVPPPQPVPEPRPEDATTPIQHNAQERIAQPDTVEQERVSALAIARETARKEQEAKRRQEQIDLTERKRVEEAEQRRRLAEQQEEDRQKKIAAERKKATEEAERQKKLAEEQRKKAEDAQRQQRLAQIRQQREQAEREAKAAEAKLKQLTAARASQAAAAGGGAAASTPQSGGGGSSDDLTAKYAAAIQQAVLNQWVRPETIPVGQKCRLTIRQLPGGEVADVSFAGNCPYDDAGRRSVEAAVRRAQPLPYRGFESVFQRTLTFNFEARDR